MHAYADGPAEREVTYRRDELYEQVWAEPVRDVAKRYGVSGVALAKTCRKLDVPLPGRGYWAKQRAGKAPPRPPLPPTKGRKAIIVERAHSPALTAKAATIPVPAIPVPAALRNPHSLVAATRQVFSEASRDDRLTWAHFKGGLDITVSRGLSQRALRIADALIKHLERAGMEVRVRATSRDGYGYRVPESTHVTEVRCDEEWVGFALREKRSEHREEPDPQKAARGWPWDYAPLSYVPNGRLELSLTNPRLTGMRKTWSDGKRQRVEDVLGNFVVHLHLAAAQVKEIREEDRRRLEARLEAQRRREEEAERRRLEQEKLERLTGEAATWQRAKQLREYAQEGLRILAAGAEAEVDETRGAELAWLLEYADRIDPLSD